VGEGKILFARHSLKGHLLDSSADRFVPGMGEKWRIFGKDLCVFGSHTAS